MSLIHWWPLNGNTRDKITNTQLTNNGATVVNNGKIGQCYTFNGSTNLTIPYSSLYTLGTNPAQFSFALWIKLNSTWSGWGQVFTIGRNGGSWTDIRIGFDIANDKTGYFTISDGSTATSYNGPKHALTIDKWHHIAATFDNKEMKLFVDGQPASTPQATSSVLPSFSSDTIIAIGGNSSEKGECDMNDVRIYDHVLSQAEVKELSKALVIHYNFNDVWIESTTNLLPLAQQTQSNTAATIEVTEGLVDGATYTLSTYVTRDPACTSTNPRLTLRFFYSDGTNTSVSKYNDGGVSYPKDGVERYYYITATANPNKTLTKVGGWLLDHSSGSGKKMTATRSQLEIRDHPTPYTPDSRIGTVTDESGYSYPAALYNNCKLTTDTNRGTMALHTAGKPDRVAHEDCSYLRSDMGTLITPTEFTISFDAKVNQWGVQTSGVLSLNINSEPKEYLTSTFVQYDSNFRLNSSADNTQANISYGIVTVGQWHHYAFVWNGSTLTAYKDGVQYGQSVAAFTADPFRYVFLGYDRAGGAGRDADVTWGNFRLYMTALNSEEIARLHGLVGYVSDANDVCGREFVEEEGNIKIQENHQCLSTEISELPSYIETSGSLGYFDTQYIPVSNDYSIEVDVRVKDFSSFDTLAGFMYTGDTTPRCGIHIYSSKYMFGANATTSATTPLPADDKGGERIILKARFKSGAQQLYRNGEQIATNTTSFNHTINRASIWLLSRNNYTNSTSTSTAVNATRVEFYGAKIYEGTEEVRNYIPWYDDELKTNCLYETHTNAVIVGQGVLNSAFDGNKQAKFYNDGKISGRQIIEI